MIVMPTSATTLLKSNLLIDNKFFVCGFSLPILFSVYIVPLQSSGIYKNKSNMCWFLEPEGIRNLEGGFVTFE